MIEVTPIPCFKDNYSYAVRDSENANVVIVDACETAPIERFLDEWGLRLAAILTTHHHHDHVGGNLALAARFACPIYGFEGERERIPGITTLLEDDETFSLFGIEWRAMHVPGHTKGALCYVAEERAFTGDTLFSGGCGCLFEGTPAEMKTSLARILSLPEATLLYTGHEYAEGNLRFSRELLPNDRAIEKRYDEIKVRRSRGEVTAFASVAEERRSNIFARTDEPEVQAAVGYPGDALATFAELRKRKNVF